MMSHGILGLICMLLVLFHNSFAFAPSPVNQYHDHRLATALNLKKNLAEAMADAQHLQQTAPGSPECKVAWDIVEELEAADSHRDGDSLSSSSSQFNQNDPNVEALLMSFDILLTRIDEKMDQLIRTTESISQMGNTDPALEELFHASNQMRQSIANYKQGQY